MITIYIFFSYYLKKKTDIERLRSSRNIVRIQMKKELKQVIFFGRIYIVLNMLNGICAFILAIFVRDNLSDKGKIFLK